MTRRIFVFALMLIAAAACGRFGLEQQDSSRSAEPTSSELKLSVLDAGISGAPEESYLVDAAPTPPESYRALATAGRQIIRTSEIEMVVEDSEAVGAGIQDLAKSLGGYVDGMSAVRRGDLLDYHLTIRVPSERLSEALAAVRKLGLRVESEKQAAADVTDTYADLDARLRTLKATEVELLALLSESRQRGRKVDDIMAVYRELTGIRTEIEQAQARLNSMERQVSYSAIDVVLRPNPATLPAVPDGWRPGETVGDAARALVTVAKGLGNGAIYVAILILPLVLVLSVPALLGVGLWRRVRRRV